MNGIRSRRKFLHNSMFVGASSVVGGVASATPVVAPPVLLPGSRAYATAVQPFNTEVKHRPSFAFPCTSEDEVAAVVRAAVGRNLPLSVKSGGHSFAGFSLSDGGGVIELSGLKNPRLFADGRFTCGPGIRLGEVYDFTLTNGRLLPAGSCSGVGLAGLCLGGGYGLFSRQFGLTCDHLQRVRMVDGRGKIRDSDDDPDLLWACRGGGNGNFGVVTHFEFVTQVAPPKLGAQMFRATLETPEAAVEMMRRWFAIAGELPDPIYCAHVLNGKQLRVLMTSTYSPSGPAFRRAREAFEAIGLRASAPTHGDLAPAIRRYYGRPDPLPFHNMSGGFYDGFGDIQDAALDACRKVLPNPGLLLQINTVRGQISRGPESAYVHRGVKFLGEIQSYWEPGQTARRARLISAANDVQELFRGAGVHRHYRNYPDASLPDWERAYWGDAYPRLQELKTRYDPDNRFRHPQSVRAM